MKFNCWTIALCTAVGPIAHEVEVGRSRFDGSSSGGADIDSPNHRQIKV